MAEDLIPGRTRRRFGVHPAVLVAAAAFIALLGAAGFRAAPSVLMLPLQSEYGWNRSVLSLAVSINLVLFGLTAPFAASLMDRFGVKRVVATALVLVSAGSGLTVFVRTQWELVLTWGVLVGLGTGSMALVFASTIAQRWFVKRRGLITGVLTAGSATGQLIFLPVIAAVTDSAGWRWASLVIAAAALAVVPIVLVFLHNYPANKGVRPYGADPSAPVALPAKAAGSAAASARRALKVLREASHHRTFWGLVAGFAICGATTNGLIGTHFIPAAHDHGLTEQTSANLLAVVGIFDIVGTIASGWLTDRFNPRILLAIYYGGRGAGLLMLPGLLSDQVHPSIVAFVVVYGLDWVATVPPTAALCRQAFGEDGNIVFGWVFASHQIGAALASTAAGVIRDQTGAYTIAWFGAAGMCLVAALVSFQIKRLPAQKPPVEEVEDEVSGGASQPVTG